MTTFENAVSTVKEEMRRLCHEGQALGSLVRCSIGMGCNGFAVKLTSQGTTIECRNDDLHAAFEEAKRRYIYDSENLPAA